MTTTRRPTPAEQFAAGFEHAVELTGWNDVARATIARLKEAEQERDELLRRAEQLREVLAGEESVEGKAWLRTAILTMEGRENG